MTAWAVVSLGFLPPSFFITMELKEIIKQEVERAVNAILIQIEPKVKKPKNRRKLVNKIKSKL